MKPILNKTNQIHYVETSDIVRFIRENSDMGHNTVCDFIRDHNICGDEYGPGYWNKQELIDSPEGYNEEQIKWISAFFEAHPWIEQMMIVFND
jgi:hypothetical protein